MFCVSYIGLYKNNCVGFAGEPESARSPYEVSSFCFPPSKSAIVDSNCFGVYPVFPVIGLTDGIVIELVARILFATDVFAGLTVGRTSFG